MTKKIVFSVGLAFSLLFATSSFADCDIDRHRDTHLHSGQDVLHELRYDTDDCAVDYHGKVQLKFELWLYGVKLREWTTSRTRKRNRHDIFRGGDTTYSEDYNMRMFVDQDGSNQRIRWKQVHRMNRMKINH